MIKNLRRILSVLSALLVPFGCSAHGVGQVYALPIPLKYYLGSAGLVVAVSFFVFAYFLSSEKKSEPNQSSYNARWITPFIFVLRIVVFVSLILAILTGIFGQQNALHNFAPIAFWVIFLLGFSILSLFIGNIWDKVNPWKTLVNLIGLPEGTKKISPWISVSLLLGLFWFELSSGVSFLPQAVGSVLFLYTVLNVVMASRFGNWFTQGELFSVLFGFIGNLAYFHIGDDNKSIIYLPLSRRLSADESPWPTLGIAAVMLAGTSFDSFKETVIWFRLLKFLGFAGLKNLILPNTIGLLLFPIPFVVLYLLVMWLMGKVTKTPNWPQLARRFVYSLVPIAFGYTLAHNFSLFIVTAPQFLGIISDPFGFGWNLFHTSSLATSSLILGAKVIWFIEIGFVVAAHVIGTLFAHILATKIMPNPKKVLISQYPTLFLMVAFTITTLWLLAQPLVISK